MQCLLRTPACSSAAGSLPAAPGLRRPPGATCHTLPEQMEGGVGDGASCQRAAADGPRRQDGWLQSPAARGGSDCRQGARERCCPTAASPRPAAEPGVRSPPNGGPRHTAHLHADCRCSMRGEASRHWRSGRVHRASPRSCHAGDDAASAAVHSRPAARAARATRRQAANQATTCALLLCQLRLHAELCGRRRLARNQGAGRAAPAA